MSAIYARSLEVPGSNFVCREQSCAPGILSGGAMGEGRLESRNAFRNSMWRDYNQQLRHHNHELWIV